MKENLKNFKVVFLMRNLLTCICLLLLPHLVKAQQVSCLDSVGTIVSRNFDLSIIAGIDPVKKLSGYFFSFRFKIDKKGKVMSYETNANTDRHFKESMNVIGRKLSEISFKGCENKGELILQPVFVIDRSPQKYDRAYSKEQLTGIFDYNDKSRKLYRLILPPVVISY